MITQAIVAEAIKVLRRNFHTEFYRDFLMSENEKSEIIFTLKDTGYPFLVLAQTGKLEAAFSVPSLADPLNRIEMTHTYHMTYGTNSMQLSTSASHKYDFKYFDIMMNCIEKIILRKNRSALMKSETQTTMFSQLFLNFVSDDISEVRMELRESIVNDGLSFYQARKLFNDPELQEQTAGVPKTLLRELL